MKMIYILIRNEFNISFNGKYLVRYVLSNQIISPCLMQSNKISRNSFGKCQFCILSFYWVDGMRVLVAIIV